MALIGVFALLNLITPAVLEKARSEELPMILIGMIAGQLGLLAVWGVLGPQRLLVRFSATMATAALLYCMFLLGMAMIDVPGFVLPQFSKAILMLPLIFLAAQFPVWVLRGAIGCCIVFGGGGYSSSPAESRQFSLQHMLGATTVVAMALGLARLGLPD